jgi:MFS family permease
VSGRFARILPAPGVERTLAGATLVNTIGNGLFLTGQVFFLTRVVGLGAGQVGIGLAVVGGFSILSGVPVGHWGDRHGLRETLVAATLAQALTTGALLFVRSFSEFLVVAAFFGAASGGANATRQALTANSLDSERRVRNRAYQRAVTNVGISLGAIIAAVALQVDSRAGYLALIAANAVTFVGASLIFLKVPHLPPVPVQAGPRLPVLRDKPFVAFIALNTVMFMHYGMLEVAVPLWIVGHTHAPRFVFSILILINTITVAAFQVRISRGSERLARSVWCIKASGVLIAISCVLFGLSGDSVVWIAVTLLIAAALVEVFGEMFQSAGSWGVSFLVAPPALQGQYQGLFGTGMSVSAAMAPLVMVNVPIRFGFPGWTALGLVFVAFGFALGPVSAWAVRHRNHVVIAAGTQ